NRNPQELFDYWRDLSNMPNFMSFLDTVTEIDSTKSHWTTKEIGGKKLEWMSEITSETPGQFLAWRTLPGSDINHSGEVRFEALPGNRGTKLTVKMEFVPEGVAESLPDAVTGFLKFLPRHKLGN